MVPCGDIVLQTPPRSTNEVKVGPLHLLEGMERSMNTHAPMKYHHMYTIDKLTPF